MTGPLLPLLLACPLGQMRTSSKTAGLAKAVPFSDFPHSPLILPSRLLSTCYVLGTTLGAEDTQRNSPWPFPGLTAWVLLQQLPVRDLSGVGPGHQSLEKGLLCLGKSGKASQRR